MQKFLSFICCIISFSYIDIEIMPKRPISIRFSWFGNSIICTKTSSNYWWSSHSDSFHSWWTVSFEKYQFESSHQKSDSPKFILGADFSDFSHYLNTFSKHLIVWWFIWTIYQSKSGQLWKKIRLKMQYVWYFNHNPESQKS